LHGKKEWGTVSDWRYTIVLILKQVWIGTTYGSHYAASIAVLDVIEEQNLMANASKVETYF
jgi:4-aminobutyrate aminotransferase-like enzyme